MSANVSPKTAQQLLHALEQDLTLATHLLELLQAEKTSLQQRQYPAYQETVKEKTQVLLQLDQADNERKSLMQQMGLSPDRKGFAHLLERVPAAWKDKFTRLWNALSDTMNRCARLNKINGKILAHSQSTMDRLMQVIRGTHQQPLLYQANGRRNLGANQRILATA